MTEPGSHEPNPIESQTDEQTPVPGVRLVDSSHILGGEREIWIRHGDAVYRLCETKSGKLILQK